MRRGGSSEPLFTPSMPPMPAFSIASSSITSTSRPLSFATCNATSAMSRALSEPPGRVDEVAGHRHCLSDRRAAVDAGLRRLHRALGGDQRERLDALLRRVGLELGRSCTTRASPPRRPPARRPSDRPRRSRRCPWRASRDARPRARTPRRPCGHRPPSSRPSCRDRVRRGSRRCRRRSRTLAQACRRSRVP